MLLFEEQMKLKIHSTGFCLQGWVQACETKEKRRKKTRHRPNTTRHRVSQRGARGGL